MISASNVWIMACRPKTLTAAAIPILVGTSLAYSLEGKVQLGLSVLALVSAIFIQIGTNLINDAMDFKKGADRQGRLGPTRVTQSGLLTSSQVWWGGILSFIAAAAVALPLVHQGGWPILLIGCLSLLAGYAYTGGPFPLAYQGLGDLFVLVFFGWVAVGGMYYINTGHLNWSAVIAGSQVGLLATVMIAVNNLRDRAMDVQVGKKTMAVRLGAAGARVEIASLCFLPFLMGTYWWNTGYLAATFLPLLLLPLALKLNLGVHSHEPGVIYNRFLGMGAALHLFFGVLMSLGFWIHA